MVPEGVAISLLTEEGEVWISAVLVGEASIVGLVVLEEPGLFRFQGSADESPVRRLRQVDGFPPAAGVLREGSGASINGTKVAIESVSHPSNEEGVIVGKEEDDADHVPREDSVVDVLSYLFDELPFDFLESVRLVAKGSLDSDSWVVG
ncbi:hypothetical protein ACN28E_52300 [Archangium lansingense]|uniref:hypothetical protein n=1 Tax=Archangium lansingense TaxID=2995310 RepID=UPI003B78EEE7